MYRQRRVACPGVREEGARRAVWKLLRLVIVLAAATAVAAGAAAQASAAGASGQAIVNRPVGDLGQTTPPSEPTGHRPAPGWTSLVIKVDAGLSAASIRQLVADHGGEPRTSIPALHLLVVDVPSHQVGAVRAGYAKDPRVKSVELDRVRKVAAAPSDPDYGSQWSLPRIGLDMVYGSVSTCGSVFVVLLERVIHDDMPVLV